MKISPTMTCQLRVWERIPTNDFLKIVLIKRYLTFYSLGPPCGSQPTEADARQHMKSHRVSRKRVFPADKAERAETGASNPGPRSYFVSEGNHGQTGCRAIREFEVDDLLK